MLVRIKIILSLPLKPKRSKIRFEVHITEHCNLNCKACNNFSCIATPEFVDVVFPRVRTDLSYRRRAAAKPGDYHPHEDSA